MSTLKRLVRVVLLAPLYLILFTVVHELGHTAVARLAGDPESTFYLVRVGDESGMCLGCNVTEHSRLPWAGNLLVSLSGLGATQAVALGALVTLRSARAAARMRRAAGAVALGYAFLDVPVQVIQGLLYELEEQVWPTGVDLVDVMLLVREPSPAPEVALKGVLAAGAVAYLVWFLRAYRRGRVA